VEMRLRKSIQEGGNELQTSTAKPAAMASGGTVRWPALGAVVGPVLFTLSWFVLGFLSPGYTLWGTRIAPYSPMSQPVSGLGLGSTSPNNLQYYFPACNSLVPQGGESFGIG
jgi:hypothetical protein